MPDWLTQDLASELAQGVLVTIALVCITSVLSVAVGLIAASWRRGGRPMARRLAVIFIEIFRNVPALILLIFFAFALPNVLGADHRRTVLFDNPFVDSLSEITTLPLPYYALAAVAALTANTGAHLAEVFRSGMDAVSPARIEAARSLGATARRANWSITVPDGVRISFPGLVNRLVHNLKNTALVGLVAVPDAFQEIRGAIDETFEATQLLILAALLYLALAAGLEFLLSRVELGLWRGRPIDRMVDV